MIHQTRWTSVSLRPTHPELQAWIWHHQWHHITTETQWQTITPPTIWTDVHTIILSQQSTYSGTTPKWTKSYVPTTSQLISYVTPHLTSSSILHLNPA